MPIFQFNHLYAHCREIRADLGYNKVPSKPSLKTSLLGLTANFPRGFLFGNKWVRRKTGEKKIVSLKEKIQFCADNK